MVDKERLLGIEALAAGELSDEQLDAYMMELYFFCDTLPSHEATLKATLEEKDYGAFLSFLDSLCSFLSNIHADSLAGECKRKHQELSATVESGQPIPHDQLTEELNALFATLDTLSIDILVAAQINDFSKPETQKTAEEKAIEGDGERVYTILAVDDAEFYLRMLKIHFNDKRYELHGVTSAEAAIRFLVKPGQKAPDLIMLDTDMPKVSGYELAVVIRKVGVNAPIVFLTNVASREVVTEALKAGGVDLIIKSSSKKQFIERVNKHI